MKITTKPCKPITNKVEFLNPILSKRAPLTDGPTKAPSANVLVHKPDTKP